jgi:hypothetical protein
VYTAAQGPCYGLDFDDGTYNAPLNCGTINVFIPNVTTSVITLNNMNLSVNYTVTSPVASDYIYLSTGPTSGNFASGQGSVTFSSPVNGTVYLYVTSSSICSFLNSVNRTVTLSRSCFAPIITGFTPASGCGDVVVSGFFLTGTTAVTVGGVSHNFVINNSGQLTIPAVASTGQIAITNPAGTATSSTNYIFNPCPPSVSSFTPSSGCGLGVTVSGTNFRGVLGVTVGGVNTPFTVRHGDFDAEF